MDTITRPPTPTESSPTGTPQQAPEQAGEAVSLNKFKPRSRQWGKKALWILLGLGISGLTVMMLQPKPVSVELGPVERGELAVTIDAEGQTRLTDQFVVAAPVAGRLARLQKEVGDTVQTGELLTTIDPLPLTTQVKSAQAKLAELKAQLAGVETQRPKLAALAIAQNNIRAAKAHRDSIAANMTEAKAELAQARLDRDRAQRLAADGVISRQQRESAELRVVQQEQKLQALSQQQEQALAEIQAAQNSLQVLQAERQDPDYLQRVYTAQIKAVEAELANLANEVGQTKIYAPVSGKLLRIHQESARFVQAGTPLFELGNPQDLELVIDVLSTDAVKIKPGNTISIYQWGGDQPLMGQVKYIEPAAFTEVSALGVDEQRVNVVGAFLSPRVPLGSEYRVNARIKIWEGQDVLKVPISALFRCQQDWCVFVERQGRAQQQPLEIAQRNDSAAVVTAGLEPSDRVILYPSEQIKSGKRIEHR